MQGKVLKHYAGFAFEDSTTSWLQSGGYERKNRILYAMSSEDIYQLEWVIDDYLEFLIELVQNDIEKAYESVRYIWTQASAIAIYSGLNDWVINAINHKNYLLLEKENTVTEALGLCKAGLLEYAEAIHSYSKEKEYSVLVKDICQYIRRHVHDGVSLSAIAEKYNFSVSYVSHCFKNETGMAVSNFIMSEKIAVAKAMISENVPFLEIANQLDFSSQSHFTRQFKKITNMTPKQYKKSIIL